MTGLTSANQGYVRSPSMERLCPQLRRHLRILADCALYAVSGWLVLAFEAPILHGFESRLLS